MNRHADLLEWCAKHRDMLISPRNAAKLLGIDESFLKTKIKLGQLRIADVCNGINRILLSDAQRLVTERKM
jgi:hypothetical protein